MLEAKDVEKTYDVYSVINGINLTIERGDFMIITGKSGSGKSTLMYILSGLEEPTKGSVTFEGVDIYKLSDDAISKYRRTKIGFVFQFYNLIPSLTVKDNILLSQIIDSKKINIGEKLYSIINDMGINDILDKYPYMLSGGQQQRVAIARALAIDPDIIFADEPTGNLDSEMGEKIMNLFEMLNKKYKKTIVIVTHDNAIIEHYGNRNIVIRNGKIV